MKKTIFILFVSFVFSISHVYGQEISKSDIEIIKEESSEPGKILITYVKNKSSVSARVTFVNDNPGTKSIDLKSGEERKVKITCYQVKAKAVDGNGGFINLYSIRKEVEPKPKPEPKPNPIIPEPQPDEPIHNPKGPGAVIPKPETKPEPIRTQDVISDFCNYLESVPFLSQSAIEDEKAKIEEHIDNLRNRMDKDDYIRKNQLNKYKNTTSDSIDYYFKNSASFIINYLGKFKSRGIENETECTKSLQKIINDRLEQRKANIKQLDDELNILPISSSFSWKNLDWKLIGICAGSLVLLSALFVWYRRVNRNDKKKTALAKNDSNETVDAASAIVVRRKTTSILRKQSLEDVEGNDAYLRIDCNDFCDNSAVRRIYMKNTCIKDIYNMYAEDLRNPDNPKEDGCMVLGRWVHDTEANEYYVSLEQIVLPGDDAIFSEYELNFGGKIKLKVTEKLRKLRRETNLQYDLTCWVHSHPGLGVFFSNSDCNVQQQLKHPTHPNFLTAMVVDILTPQQELGIFTFKHDSTINSKAELKKMYSLEEMYEWALKSERNSFKREDYYNTLSDAKVHANDCYGIELSNGAIIDMGLLAAEQTTGLVGMIHGYSIQQGVMTEHIAEKIARGETADGNDFVGCFIIATHCSIPSLRRTIANYMSKIKFVLVYATTDGVLTSIPIVNNDICADENYYGEQQLEDLKIWTRRKR